MLTSRLAFRLPALPHATHGPRAFASQVPCPSWPHLSPLVRTLSEKMAALPPALGRRQVADALDLLACTHREALVQQAREPTGCGADQADRALDRKMVCHLYSLLEVGPPFLRTFATDCPRTGAPVMDPAIAQARQEESEKSFALMMALPKHRTQALVYASLVHPVLHKAFGITLSDSEHLSAFDHLASGHDHQYLDRHALLTLRHYTHPDTGVFNVYRAAHEVQRLCPELDIAAPFRPLLEHFAASVAAVHESPAARSKAPLYRGMIWGNEPLPRPGDCLRIDRPTSASTDPAHSFAGRVSQTGQDYDLALQLHDGPTPGLQVHAVDAGMFHTVATLHQEESLLLAGQLLKVTGEVRQEPVRRGHRLVPLWHCEACRTGEDTCSPQAPSL